MIFISTGGLIFDMKNKKLSPIEIAISVCDGVANLAIACNVSQQAVYKWIKKGYPPLERCESIELATKGKVSRFDLLPEKFKAGSTSSKKHQN